jgi:hypothetical protein
VEGFGSCFCGDWDLLLGADVIPPLGVLFVLLGVVASTSPVCAAWPIIPGTSAPFVAWDPTPPSNACAAGRDTLAALLLGDADGPLPGVFLTGVVALSVPLGPGMRLGVLGAPASGDNLRRLLGDCDIAIYAPTLASICLSGRLCIFISVSRQLRIFNRFSVVRGVS